MPSDYEQICRDNIRRRGEEFDDIGRLISEQLYSDRTHFIYELLQNAEDALGRRKRNNPESKLPTSVRFLLYKDRLEFRHFGEEFNTDDVKGISDVLKGTKAEDKTQIGRFGIGFKSVYAFTSTPEIHSGDEHFLIERYIRPRGIDRIPHIAEGETVFIFPFNHKDLSKEQAFQLIGEKLKKIGSRVLLFLRNITEIEWKIEGHDEGLYLKESQQLHKSVQRVSVIGQQGNDYEEEEWLVFRKPIKANPSFKNSVEVAFRLIEDKSQGKKVIRRISSSPLVVYFPTKLETRLGFLIQGPYDTIASRSDIEDNEWNKKLIIETAHLLTESVLPWLKEQGLLNISFLEALPIKPDDFPKDSLFRPIYEKVRIALRDQEFLPTADGKYVAGRHAVLARAEDIIDLINPKQLSRLMESPVELKWLTTEITETKKKIHRYLVGWKPKYQWETEEEIEPLIVDEIRPEDIVEKITRDFLQDQSITWIIKFYAFLRKRPALIDSLKHKPIIRLQDGTHVPPFKEDGSPNAYLPPENDTEFPVVSREIVKDERALEFLKDKLRLKKPGAVAEVIEHVLPKYEKPNPKISKDEHFKDIEKILKAYETDSLQDKKLLVEKLKNTPFVRSENLALQQVGYKKPGQLYFKSKELAIYFDGNEDAWFVSSEYDKKFYNLLKNLGINDEIWVRCKSKWDSRDHVYLGYENGRYKRGLKGFDPDIQVDGLEYAIMNPSPEKSKIIWNKIAAKYHHCIKGKILISSRQDFSPMASTYREEEIISSFGHLLRDSQWLPDKQGNFHKPAELKLDDLPESFIPGEKLADQLDMKKDIVTKLAKELGVDPGDIELLRRHPKEFEQWKATLTKKKKPIFPQKISLNPERRQERLEEQISNALEKEYEARSRSVRVSANTIDKETYLRNAYTNDDGQMVCQICKEEMPFRKRDGEYYFEAVEMLSIDYLPKEHEAQYLALCPLCAAMYKEFIKQDREAMESLKNALINSELSEIPLQLGELDTSVRFVETHFQDIRTIIKTQE